MEQKELKISIPEGYEIDKEKSTFENIVFKSVKNVLDYDDIMKALFQKSIAYFVSSEGEVRECLPNDGYNRANHTTSVIQGKKILAINKLINVAKYLNGGWRFDLSKYDHNSRWYIYHDVYNNTLLIGKYIDRCSVGQICFKTKELAQKAIDILGEETIKLALSCNY